MTAQRAALGDVEIAYEIHGSGPRLVWAHGLASCVDGDRDVVEAFAASFTVLAYDARSHGRSSPVRDPAKLSYRTLGDDLIGLLDHLGWERAVLAGASMGAATCARVAMLEPARAAVLVLARPAAMGDDGCAPPWLQMLFAGGAEALRRGGIDAAIDFLMTIPLARVQLEQDPARIDRLREEWTRHDPLSMAAALEGIPRTSPVAGGLAGSMITCPTFVVPGDDLIHPLDTGRAVAAMIPGAVCAPAFDSLPRARETERFVESVRAFLLERSGLT